MGLISGGPGHQHLYNVPNLREPVDAAHILAHAGMELVLVLVIAAQRHLHQSLFLLAQVRGHFAAQQVVIVHGAPQSSASK